MAGTNFAEVTRDMVAQCVANASAAPLSEVKLVDYVETDGSEYLSDNFTCKLKAITAEAEVRGGAAKKFEFMAKCAPRLMHAEILDVEIAFYDKVMPALKSYDCQIQVPACYYTSKEDGLFIMENLKKSGFGLAIKSKPLIEEHTHLILEQLGRLHAAGYHFLQKEYGGSLEKFQEAFPMMVHKAWLFDAEDLTQMVSMWFVKVFETVTDILKNCTDDDALLKRAEDLGLEELKKRAFAEMEPSETGFNTLTHNDSWKNNYMFKGNTEVKMLDLQIVRYASPGCDLNYFLASALSPDYRQANIDDLLKVYHGRFAACLANYGYDPEKLYTLEQAKEDYLAKKTFGFCFGVLHTQQLIEAKDKVDMSRFIGAAKEDIGRLQEEYYEEVKVKNRELPYIRDAIIGLTREAAAKGVFDK